MTENLFGVVARLRGWMRKARVIRDEDPPVRVTIEVPSQEAAAALMWQLKAEWEPLLWRPSPMAHAPFEIELDQPVKIMGIEFVFRRRAEPVRCGEAA